ncbi:peptidoglycan-binding protein [Halalkalibacillus halophilus]|uniref:peptidoglycan-binding protein n=1 Tax=Halalkalibacillus halophilus TaxID=392827 RepID=UPI00041EC9CF|nr:peptidoglycan-binding protein [Halalkalibacillus halophilus]
MKKIILNVIFIFTLVLFGSVFSNVTYAEENNEEQDVEENESSDTYEEPESENEDEDHSDSEETEEARESEDKNQEDESEEKSDEQSSEESTEEDSTESEEQSKEEEENLEESENEESEANEKEEEQEEQEEVEEETETDESEEQESEEESESMSFSISNVEQYTVGDEGDHVVEMKQKLVDMGFVSWNPPSQYYGDITARYVSEFQEYYGLPETGEADQATRDKMDQVLNVPYASGDRGDPVVSLKEKLVELGFAGWSNPSQFYGSITAGVVADFQEAYGLTPNGVADTETINRINAALQEASMYQIGAEGEHVVEMKQKLVDMGFVGWNPPSRFYGSITASYVSEFQEYYGLAVTGEADAQTRAKMDEVLNPPYRDGDRGQPVVELKEKLVELGFAGWSSPSQFYGPITSGVVEDFQQAHGLTVNGVADLQTLAKLDELVAESKMYQLGDSGEHVRLLKENLVRVGVANWNNPSTSYDEDTVAAVEEFQEYYEMEVTGNANDSTREKLEEVLNLPYVDGDRGQPVVQLKEKLVELGFAGWSSPSQFYGPITSGVVKDFQRAYGLPVTGIVDEQTFNELDTLSNADRYHRGDRGSHIVDLKEDLELLGFVEWDSINEFYDNELEALVSEFQMYYMLSATGVANEQTLNKMAEVLSAPYQDGDRGQPVVQLKEKLVELGFADWSDPSQFYGPITSGTVSDFQREYGLNVTGTADQNTLDELERVLNNKANFQRGDYGEHVIGIKEQLVELGIADWDELTKFYGDDLVAAVSEFQEYYSMSVTGHADSDTRSKMASVLVPPYQDGDRGQPVVTLKEKLVELGFAGWSSPSQFYGSITSDVVSDFQSYYGLTANGIANQTTLNKMDEILNSPYSIGNRGQHVVDMKTDLVELGYASWSSPSASYGEITASVVRDFQADNNLIVNGIADEVTLEMIERLLNTAQVTEYGLTFNRALEIQMNSGWPKYDGAGNIDADEANVRYYLNPSNFLEGTASFLQFLLLDESTNLSARELNDSFLRNVGTLSGTGAAFIQAGDRYNINELYLMAHALHETGNGTSTLARGIGVDGSGNVIRDSSGNVVRDIDDSRVQHIVYNMYGYGAHDNNPIGGGAMYAFEREWFSPEAAVIGGASQISNNYISQGQNTLYKMKWDPEYASDNNARGKQYATHIMWPILQANKMYSMLGDDVHNYRLLYDIPQYINQPGPDGSVPPPPSTGPVEPEEPELREYPEGVIGEITTNLNFREGPSTGYDRIATIPQGTIVDLIGTSDSGWLNVRYDGDEGWVSGDYVDTLNLSIVTGTSVRYRTEPGGSNIGGSLSENDLVTLSLDSDNLVVSEEAELSGTNYNWYRIKVDGNDYWMASEFLERVE